MNYTGIGLIVVAILTLMAATLIKTKSVRTFLLAGVAIIFLLLCGALTQLIQQQDRLLEAAGEHISVEAPPNQAMSKYLVTIIGKKILYSGIRQWTFWTLVCFLGIMPFVQLYSQKRLQKE